MPRLGEPLACYERWFMVGRAGIVPASQMPAAAGRPHAARSLLQTMHYVEGNPAHRQLVARLVARRPDMRMLTASAGPLGIAGAREHLPDVILMDDNLAGIAAGIEPGFLSYLTKPVHGHTFLGAIDQVLDDVAVRKSTSPTKGELP